MHEDVFSGWASFARSNEPKPLLIRKPFHGTLDLGHVLIFYCSALKRAMFVAVYKIFDLMLFLSNKKWTGSLPRRGQTATFF